MDFSIRSVLVAFFLLNVWQSNAALRTYDFTVHRGVRAPGKSKHPVLSDLVLYSSTDNDQTASVAKSISSMINNLAL